MLENKVLPGLTFFLAAMMMMFILSLCGSIGGVVTGSSPLWFLLPAGFLIAGVTGLAITAYSEIVKTSNN